ncbi:MAG: hypothetical protein MUF66_02500 [Gammaproteobacteria bacterium]|nr:hypothetical protein [Gammaproteobacteria bacterium]
MRVIFLLLGVALAAGWAGWAVRGRDPIASGLLYALAVLALGALASSLIGWP